MNSVPQKTFVNRCSTDFYSLNEDKIMIDLWLLKKQSELIKINIETQSLIAGNQHHIYNFGSPAYVEDHFIEKALQIEKIIKDIDGEIEKRIKLNDDQLPEKDYNQ